MKFTKIKNCYFSQIYDNSLTTVLDNIKSLNLKIEKMFHDFEITAENKSLIFRRSRLTSSWESDLIQYLNKCNIFATEADRREKKLKKNVAVPYEELDDSFVFTIGHYLQDIYEKDAETAALLKFGDLQVIVSNFGESSSSFNSLLKKWNKVALLSVRWTCFEAFLRRLVTQTDNQEQIVNFILALLISEDLANLLASLFNCWDQKPFTKELLNCLFDVSANVINSPTSNKKASLEKYCEIIRKLYKLLQSNRGTFDVQGYLLTPSSFYWKQKRNFRLEFVKKALNKIGI